MSHLFQPLRLNSLTLKNRIAVSPMCQYSAEDGFANDWHLVHLGSRAVGGAAIVMVEATAVSPEARITLHDLGLWKDEHIEPLQRIASFISSQGAIPAIQLAHAGRKASTNQPWLGSNSLTTAEGAWQTVAPSAIPYKPGMHTPVALDQQGVQKVIKDFIVAAKRALAAGFKVLEIHAAHGYLLHEFLSPLTNTRTDEYGGNLPNRMRLLLQLTAAIRNIWPSSLSLWVRISCTDHVEGGWNLQESIELSKQLKQLGVDLVDCSSGGNINGARIKVEPLYQTPYAEAIRKEAGIMTGAVGLITTAPQAESIIAEGKADMVLMARQMLRDPYFPLHAAHELREDFPWPLQYERAK